jgi:hypothetical protein
MGEDRSVELRLIDDSLPLVKGFLETAAPFWLLRPVYIHEKCNPGSLSTKLAWMGLSAGFCLANLLKEAMSTSGREVVERICLLHRNLECERSGGNLAEQDERLDEFLKPCLGWWNHHRRPGSAWKRVWLGWIEVFSERLTMARYSDPLRRTQHAQVLLANPMWTITREACRLEGKETFHESAGETECVLHFCEWLIRFWDLIHADQMAASGWNRVELQPDRQMGGFYGLSDHVEMVNRDIIQRAARDLREEIGTGCAGVQDGYLRQAWFSQVQQHLQRALDEYLGEGTWPDGGGPDLSGEGGSATLGWLKKFFKAVD